MTDSAIAVGRRRRTTVTLNQSGAELLSACESGDYDQAAALIESRAFVNWADANGTTPLHAAADNPHAHAIAELLLDNKANVEAAEAAGLGATPLSRATRSGNRRVVEVLLEAGAQHASVSEEVLTFALESSERGGDLADEYCATLELLRLARRAAPLLAPDGTAVECPVCLSAVLQFTSVSMPCCHRAFHRQCVRGLRRCPWCRSPLRTRHQHREQAARHIRSAVRRHLARRHVTTD